MAKPSTTTSSSSTNYQSVQDQVIDLRRKLQVLREHDQSHSEDSPAALPMRVVPRLHPKQWRRRRIDDNAPNPVAGVLFAWIIYLVLGGAIIAIALHYGARHQGLHQELLRKP